MTIDDDIMRMTQEDMVDEIMLLRGQRKALIEALKELMEQIRSHQRPHQCPGFDCSTCTPIEALSYAEIILDEIEKVKP